MKIKPTLVGFSGDWGIRLNVESVSHKNPECANSYLENPPNRILNRFFELNSAENKMQLKSESEGYGAEFTGKKVFVVS